MTEKNLEKIQAGYVEGWGMQAAERDVIREMFAVDASEDYRTDLVPGLKRNEHKRMLTLVPPEFMEELAAVFEYGLGKYERNSWRNFTPEQAMSCLPDAALRHLFAWLKGEIFDPDSGLPHLQSAAWNLLVTDYHTRLKG